MAIRDNLLQRPENGNGSRSFWFLATWNDDLIFHLLEWKSGKGMISRLVQGYATSYGQGAEFSCIYAKEQGL